jgi:hypothetical protein
MTRTQVWQVNLDGLEFVCFHPFLIDFFKFYYSTLSWLRITTRKLKNIDKIFHRCLGKMFIDILIADGIANVNLLLEDISLGIFDRIVLPKK